MYLSQCGITLIALFCAFCNIKLCFSHIYYQRRTILKSRCHDWLLYNTSNILYLANTKLYLCHWRNLFFSYFLEHVITVMLKFVINNLYRDISLFRHVQFEFYQSISKWHYRFSFFSPFWVSCISFSPHTFLTYSHSSIVLLHTHREREREREMSISLRIMSGMLMLKCTGCKGGFFRALNMMIIFIIFI